MTEPLKVEPLNRLEVLELQRFYRAYVAEQGPTPTWGLRSEIFEALIAAALLPPPSDSHP